MERAARYNKNIAPVLLILAVVLLSYFNASFNGFVFDDRYLIVKNPDIKGWSGVTRLFTSGYWSSTGKSGGLYRPLTMCSFLLEYAAVGLKPALYHVDNIILHFLCSVLSFFIMKSFLTEEKTPLFAALLFAVHPVHTEAVAWVTGRAELLSAFFSMLSALIFLNKRGRAGWTFLYSLLFLLALLSKESALVIPALMAVYLLIYENEGPVRARLASLVSRLYPFVLTFLIFMVPRVYVLGRVGPAGEEMTFLDVRPYYTFLTMCEAFTHYIRLVFFPFNLTVDYLFPPPFSFFEFKVVFPLLVLASLLLFSRRVAAFSRPALFAAVWFFVALFPVSNIIPVGIIMSERALYIPSLSACMMLGAAVTYAWPALRWRRFAVFLLFAAVMLLAAGTINRNPTWKDQRGFEKSQIDMIRHRIELFPDYAPYYAMLAGMYMEHDEYGPDVEKLLADAVRLDPGNYQAHNNYAKLFIKRSMPGKALAEARMCMKIRPSEASAYNAAGIAFHMMKNTADSEGMLDEAIRLNPGVGEYYLNKGYLRLEAGNPDAALALFERATELDPDLFDSYLQQGIILGARRRYAPAVKMFQKAALLRPESAEAHFYLGAALYGLGDMLRARFEVNAALRLRPDYPEALALIARLG